MKSLTLLCITFCLVACADVPSLTTTPTNLETVSEVTGSPTSTAISSATLTPNLTQTPMPTPTPLPTSTPSPTLVPVNVGTPIPEFGAVIEPQNVSQLAELAHWGRGVINDVAYSGNGRWIAVGTTTGVYIHDAQDLNIEPRFFETSDSVHFVDISLSGDMVAMAFNTGSIELWDVTKHEQLWAKEAKAYELQFSPDGQALAAVTSSEKNSIGIVWDLPEGEIIQTFSDLFTLQFSADSTKLAVWNYGTLSIYEWPSGVLLSQTEPILFVEAGNSEIDAQGTVISDVQFGGENEPILLNLPGNSAYGPTGRVEFQRGSDDALVLSLPPIELLSYPIQAACNVGLFWADPPSPPRVWQYEILPQAQIVALKYEAVGYVDDDRKYTSVRFYRLDSGQQLYVQDGVNAFAFSPDGETWLSGSQDGRLQIRRIIDGELLQTYDGYESPINHVVVSPDNQLVAVEYLDEVKLYRAQDGTAFRRYPAGRVAFAPDGLTIALGYEDGRIELRDTADDSLLNTLSVHTEAVTTLAFLPTGDSLISAGMDCQLNVWHLPDGRLSGSLENYLIPNLYSEKEDLVPLRVWKMMATPDGERLIGAFASSIGIWQLPDGTMQEALESQYHAGNIAFSSDGGYLAMGGYPLLMWQILPTGEVREVWQGGSSTAVTFSPDGQLLVAGLDENYVDENANGALELYLTTGRERLHRLSPGTRKVTALAFAPNGRFFVSSSLDGVIRLWGVP